MECRDLRERISAYVDGEIPAAEAHSVEVHLEGCAACRSLERKMRALTAALGRTETEVSVPFRETLFARMETEGLLRKRRSLFFYSLRWAAIPVAAAAGLALFLLSPVDRGGNFRAPEVAPPKVAQHPQAVGPTSPSAGSAAVRNVELTSEEREIIAHLEILDDPSVFEDPGEIDEMEIFTPPGNGKG